MVKIKGLTKTFACDKPHYPFELPKGWVWTTLGEIGSWQSGATPSRMNKDYYGGNIPWLKTGDLNDGTITYIPEYITQRALEETSVRLNPKGSVLIAMYGATIGKIGILSFPATTNQACCACYEYSINQMFLFYFLLANRENFIAMGGGGAQPNISKEKIISTNMPLPPLKEQERIVAEIERWLSFVDIVEIEKSDLQSTICLAKSKILDLAIHGKLVPQDPNDEPASELLKRINPKAEITCDNPQYGKLPKGWCLCHIPDVANTLLGKTLDRSKNTGTPKDYLCAINVLWGKFDFTTHKQFLLEKNEYERYAVMKGDLMVCEGGDVGRCAIWEDDSKEIYYQNALHRIRCKEGVFNYYILYLLWHYKLNGTIDYLCKGVTIKHFTQTVMNKLDILLPPFEEQKRIVAKIEDLFTQLDKIESSLQA